MSYRHWCMLALLAAIWGGSFMFMRVLSPVLGPIFTTMLRVLGAGLALQAWCVLTHTKLDWRRDWLHYLVVGLINACLPWTLYSFAAWYLPAGYSAIINAATPLFGAVFAAMWLGTSLTLRKVLALLLGMLGVAIISYRGGSADSTVIFYIAIAACVCATICYALASIYIRRFASTVDPVAMAGGSLLLGGVLWLLLALMFLPELEKIQMLGWGMLSLNVAGLTLLCSAVAMIFYYRLLQEVGQAQTLSVTFLIPIFGVLWGWVFLNEAITVNMLLGCVCVLFSTRLVVQKSS